MLRYYSALVKHFEKKGYNPKITRSKAKNYQAKLNYLKEFLENYEKRNDINKFKQGC
jgi:hypothetical protein